MSTSTHGLVRHVTFLKISYKESMYSIFKDEFNLLHTYLPHEAESFLRS
jgi:hypothetical protein